MVKYGFSQQVLAFVNVVVVLDERENNKNALKQYLYLLVSLVCNAVRMEKMVIL